MTRKEKFDKCREFFDILVDKLDGYYEELASCNQDLSAYLCPIGTTNEVSYNGKPEKSFRVSDHWNWYANTKKCKDPRYIQCYCIDLPWARKRLAENKAGKPIIASCVSIFKDGKYHVVYGEHFNRKTKKWSWIENSPEKILSEELGVL